MIAAALALRLWEADRIVPLTYDGDGLFNLVLVKGVMENGWFFNNPDLGAPFGQQLYDFSALGGDNLQWLIIKAIALFTSSPAEALNAFYFGSFPLMALTAFLVLRMLDVSRAVAVVIAILFSVVPNHLFNGEGHVFLGAAWSVPLACWLVLAVAAGEPLFERRTRPGPRLFAWASRRTMAVAAVCVIVGSTSVYYAAFAVILVMTAAALAAIKRRTGRALATGAVVTALIAATLMANLAPSTIYHIDHGPNNLVAKRVPQESEIYALKLVRLFLPIESHRLDPLAELNRKYVSSAPLPGEGRGESLGVVGAVGLAWLMAVVLMTLFGVRFVQGLERHRHAAAAALVAFLVGTTGGISALFSYVVSPQLRGWNRISIFIAFFALIAVALGLEELRRRLKARARPAWILGVPLAGVLILGWLDQTSSAVVPPYEEIKVQYRNDKDFVAAIERRLPRDAAVFQLPYIPFPEAVVPARMIDYDEFRGYVHSTDLRWSYGAMKGRPTDWEAELADEPVGQIVPAVAAAGFSGIYVDRFGYGDNGAGVERGIARIARTPPFASADNRLAFFDLRPYAAALRRQRSSAALEALGEAALKPIRVKWGAGFYPPEADGTSTWLWAGRRARATLENPSDRARSVTFSATLETGVAAPGMVAIRFPDGTSIRLRVSSKPVRVRRVVRLPPGASTVAFETTGPRTPGVEGDVRTLYLRVRDPSFDDTALAAQVPPLQPLSPALRGP
jgi:phosphoglycerol transferase